MSARPRRFRPSPEALANLRKLAARKPTVAPKKVNPMYKPQRWLRFREQVNRQRTRLELELAHCMCRRAEIAKLRREQTERITAALHEIIPKDMRDWADDHAEDCSGLRPCYIHDPTQVPEIFAAYIERVHPSGTPTPEVEWQNLNTEEQIWWTYWGRVKDDWHFDTWSPAKTSPPTTQ